MPTRHRFSTASFLCAAMLVLTLVASVSDGRAAEEPQGLLLRKGIIGWQTPLAQARPLVEESIRPNPPPELIVRRERPKPPGFTCQPAATGVTECIWACCVDLGERGSVHFATLSFYNDKFYAYDIKFNTNIFSQFASALATRLGAPSSESQENRTNFTPLQGGINSYVVSLKRWNVGDVAVLLFDRGAGGPLVGELYVAYRPLAQQASPQKPDEPPLKLPF